MAILPIEGEAVCKPRQVVLSRLLSGAGGYATGVDRDQAMAAEKVVPRVRHLRLHGGGRAFVTRGLSLPTAGPRDDPAQAFITDA